MSELEPISNALRPPGQLRDDALAIWRAGVEAVKSDRLVAEHVRVDGPMLCVADECLRLADIGRIVVVGAGKAGQGMAAGLRRALGEEVARAKQLTGWINVPADCVADMGPIHLHAGRPAGVNEPTAEGVAGVERILKLVSELGPNDLCVALLSGGGSALLPAPAVGVTLADKQAVTRALSAAGANILELNTVRKCLSRVKGGGLARACRAGRLIALIISDVLGDPLDMIASGPTVSEPNQPARALEVMQEYRDSLGQDFSHLEEVLRRQSQAPAAPPPICRVDHVVVGNNAAAVDAAGMEAERRGYSHAMVAAVEVEGAAEGVGRHLAEMAASMAQGPGPDCLISGGEPTVTLAPEAIRGLGGRNQQLVLAAHQRLVEMREPGLFEQVVVLSGGTDGEDGPTDAAGGWIDGDVACAARRQQLDAAEYLRRNDAYHFLEATGGLLKTGPTGTNVCDLRVVVVGRRGDKAPSATPSINA